MNHGKGESSYRDRWSIFACRILPRIFSYTKEFPFKLHVTVLTSEKLTQTIDCVIEAVRRWAEVRQLPEEVPSDILQSPEPGDTIHARIHQRYSVFISILTLECISKIVHAGQRAWMLGPQHPLSRLHHLHVQLFRLCPSALVPVRRGQVGHDGQRGKDARAPAPSNSSPSLAPPALPPVHQPW